MGLLEVMALAQLRKSKDVGYCFLNHEAHTVHAHSVAEPNPALAAVGCADTTDQMFGRPGSRSRAGWARPCPMLASLFAIRCRL